eukprot:4808953-Amphidinium_carterae.1
MNIKLMLCDALDTISMHVRASVSLAFFFGLEEYSKQARVESKRSFRFFLAVERRRAGPLSLCRYSRKKFLVGKAPLEKVTPSGLVNPQSS